MKLFVTGGTGFIGSAFCRVAVMQGHEIAVLTHGNAASPMGDDVLLLRGTLAEPPWNAIQKFAPDVCVHAAWISTPGVYLHSPKNDLFRDWSFEFALRLSSLGLRRLVVLGTCIEYAPSNQPLNESSSPLRPISPYARAKHDLHVRLRDALQSKATELTWARVFHPYGAGEHPQRLCSSIIQSLHRGEIVRLKTPASVKDYIHLDDLVQALALLCQRSFTGEINLGTGQGVSVEHIAKTIAGIMECSDLVEASTSANPEVYDHVVADAGRLKNLGWKQTIPLRHGLELLIRHLTP